MKSLNKRIHENFHTAEQITQYLIPTGLEYDSPFEVSRVSFDKGVRVNSTVKIFFIVRFRN